MSEEANEIKSRITDARISALETEVKELREQVKSTREWLCHLAGTCWQNCGTDFIKEMAEAFAKEQEK